MSFLAPLGLLVLVLVVGPFVAHLLRRRRPDERDFPAARLVPTAPPLARRRAHLEDRALLSLRVLAVVMLALVAASPLIRCTRLSLDRRGGASVALAIVIDDSLSMNAELPKEARRGGARTRFELALLAARELEASLRGGDAVTIVIASAPPRLALSPTQERAAVRAVLESIARAGPTHQPTDLDGALALASAALGKLPQPDRRVVLLSDLADGKGDSALLSIDPGLRLEVPLDALTRPPPAGAADCALLSASPEGGGDFVRAKVVCALGDPPSALPRTVDVFPFGSKTRAGTAALPSPMPPTPVDVLVPVDRKLLPSLEPTAAKPAAVARLGGAQDALREDDETPVLGGASEPVLGIVLGEGSGGDQVATGGAPVLERALDAVAQGKIVVRPLPSAPERDVDLTPLAGLVLDDLPGLGPEARFALTRWTERGGVLLVALGARAASPALGSSFEPFLSRPPRTEPVGLELGIDPAFAGPFGDGAEPPATLAARLRAVLPGDDLRVSVVRTKWADGAPLLAVRAMGQGEVWLLTLPITPEASDLALRPAFLAFAAALGDRVADRGASVRLIAGQGWSVAADDRLDVAPLGADGVALAPLAPEIPGPRVRPTRIGAYLVTVTSKGGEAFRELRAVVPAASEVDLRPRPLAKAASVGQTSGMQRTTEDLSPMLALLLCGIAAAELAVRVRRLASPPEPAADA